MLAPEPVAPPPSQPARPRDPIGNALERVLNDIFGGR
jgi:hypothetical protein